MLWLSFAFAAPVLWAVSTHIDKYLVDRYFHTGSVAVLMVFTGVTGLLLAAAIWTLGPGLLAQRYALLLAPLSLVQAVGGTTALFVFLFGCGLSLVAPALGREDLSAANLLRKAVAAGLVAAGVSLVSG